jgi:phage-related protein
MDVFSPAVDPSANGTTRTTNAAVNIAQFGDGYSQRAKDGLNAVSRQVALQWSRLTQEEAADLDSFFESKGGSEAFLYQIPGDSVQRAWITSGPWRNGYEYGTAGSFSVTLQEVFDLA